ncbi:DUF4158 domain-containing protein [Streptomyces tibetensis]|uniref:DUF4158 domain-containing protein n=1 Tax=Streptomyces tibetensis TaxID=2382123 RepID=UPI0033F68144
MRQDWEPEDLIDVWTLVEDDMKRVRNKSGPTRLGFALLLKFFEVEARFPESPKEVPAAAIEYVARQVKVPTEAWARGARVPGEHRGGPGAAGRVAGHRAVCAPGLESLLAEVNKLERVRRLELPADVFADVSEKLVDAWRARASKEYPANLERMKPPRRLTLVATLCHVRQTEITDSLVDLFIQLVLKINTRAERKVDKELNSALAAEALAAAESAGAEVQQHRIPAGDGRD